MADVGWLVPTTSWWEGAATLSWGQGRVSAAMELWIVLLGLREHNKGPK